MQSDLIKLPGIGKKMVVMLNEIGVKEIADLKGGNPLELYEKLVKNAVKEWIHVFYTHIVVLFM